MIVAANHLSYADVLAAVPVHRRAGRYPVFLAKSSLFSIKVLGPIIRKLGQLLCTGARPTRRWCCGTPSRACATARA